MTSRLAWTNSKTLSQKTKGGRELASKHKTSHKRLSSNKKMFFIVNSFKTSVSVSSSLKFGLIIQLIIFKFIQELGDQWGKRLTAKFRDNIRTFKSNALLHHNDFKWALTIYTRFCFKSFSYLTLTTAFILQWGN